ncbi:hypothetical protein Dtox_2898 [Desulfofarcimen acetoxidans DSM 771]|uniref:Uncharacterized protein n=1 Tax=Desulfofarcimen acetoxidans (strain ATCC 49208 / DSM 771 / KCTC 5769 / VKM B-1644 / 5575) TaxID=485916 RepID=C8W2H7_DESAS|nr:hypothetical protein Dtox_2898 [Desulfofarcimen acetoxidans DSM 771]
MKRVEPTDKVKEFLDKVQSVLDESSDNLYIIKKLESI